MDHFHGKTAIITGAASGIGLALARDLGGRGAMLHLIDLDDEKLRSAVAELTRARVDVSSDALDVTDDVALEASIKTAADRWGRLDFLFNNAGIVVIGESRDQELHHWTRVIDVNLLGVTHGVAAAYPIMVAQGSGHIVNTSSMSGLLPMPGSVAYAASKFGVVGLSHALRVEAARLGVKVSVVCPAMVETPIFESATYIGVDAKQMRDALPGKPQAVDACARQILRGVARNQSTILPGMARVLAWVHHWMPFVTTRVAQKLADTIAAMRDASSSRAPARGRAPVPTPRASTSTPTRRATHAA